MGRCRDAGESFKMSEIKGQIDNIKLKWLSVPKGPSGMAYVELEDKRLICVRWSKDSHGISVEFPDSILGYDIQGSVDDSGVKKYSLSKRNSNKFWLDLRFLKSGELDVEKSAANRKKKITLKSQMPGKIIKVLVSKDQDVEKGQPLLVMEAMKMENEICSPIAGKIIDIKIDKDKTIESGAPLLVIE